MSKIKALVAIEKIEKVFNAAKKTCVALGATEEDFAEAEAKLSETKKKVLDSMSGDIVYRVGDSNKIVFSVKTNTDV